MNRSGGSGPRKVVVGSVMFGPYGRFSGLEARLEELRGQVERLASRARERFPDRGLDIVALPEGIVEGGLRGPASARSFPLEGPILDAMGKTARDHRTYLTVPFSLAENGGRGPYRNAAVLLDRSGSVVGVYHKIHPVVDAPGDPVVDALGDPVVDGIAPTFEGGVTPGTEVPVFSCDFGLVGFQICFDISYDDGWAMLGRKGAELVIWPTKSPATVRAGAIALREGYFILSSTWRHNATLFEPTGVPAARIRSPEEVLVEEIDLDSVVLPWSPRLENGRLFSRMYGDAAGYRYYESEDCGLFWSNDSARPISALVREAGLETREELLERNRFAEEKVRPTLR